MTLFLSVLAGKKKRTLKHWREIEPLTDTKTFNAGKTCALMILDVNINLERLYLSFLESYFYGKQEMRFLFILSSTWLIYFRLFQRTLLSSGTSMFDFHFKPLWRLNPPPFLFLDCGKARCSLYSVFFFFSFLFSPTTDVFRVCC